MWKRLFVVLLAFSLLSMSMSVILAAPTKLEIEEAYERLSEKKVVMGILRPDGSVDPALNEPLSRVQMITLIMRALWHEEAASQIQGEASFPDVPGSHWASGYLALAKTLAAEKNFEFGYFDGTFRPDQTVTLVEVLAFIMKFLGLPTGSGENWVEETIALSIEKGVMTEDAAAHYIDPANEPTDRGPAFALIDYIFRTYMLPNGKTIYETFFSGDDEKEEPEDDPVEDALPSSPTGRSRDMILLVPSHQKVLQVGPERALDFDSRACIDAYQLKNNGRFVREIGSLELDWSVVGLDEDDYERDVESGCFYFYDAGTFEVRGSAKGLRTGEAEVEVIPFDQKLEEALYPFIWMGEEAQPFVTGERYPLNNEDDDWPIEIVILVGEGEAAEPEVAAVQELTVLLQLWIDDFDGRQDIGQISLGNTDGIQILGGRARGDIGLIIQGTTENINKALESLVFQAPRDESVEEVLLIVYVINQGEDRGDLVERSNDSRWFEKVGPEA